MTGAILQGVFIGDYTAMGSDGVLHPCWTGNPWEPWSQGAEPGLVYAGDPVALSRALRPGLLEAAGGSCVKFGSGGMLCHVPQIAGETRLR